MAQGSQEKREETRLHIPSVKELQRARNEGKENEKRTIGKTKRNWPVLINLVTTCKERQEEAEKIPGNVESAE
jgi:hypothetical protein